MKEESSKSNHRATVKIWSGNFHQGKAAIVSTIPPQKQSAETHLQTSTVYGIGWIIDYGGMESGSAEGAPWME